MVNKIRNKPYPPHSTIGQEELEAVIRVMKRGILSDFEGSNNEFFDGGEEVKKLEQEWSESFEIEYSVSMNSATSCLNAALGALEIGPGDEVIVSPWTMTATVTAIIVNNAVPVFCDIDRETFTMLPESVEKLITDRTKAIIPVHIYGHPAEMDKLMSLAKKYNLYVIEDAAQSPKVKYKGKYTGTIGDIGIHSLNCHKIIQCGEGGIATTKDKELAKRLKLIRNHAEAVIATGMKVKSLNSMIGWNYRLGELEAAIAREQLKKLDILLKRRRELVDYLNNRLSEFKQIILPVIKKDCGHSFYRYALRLKDDYKYDASVFVDKLNTLGMDFYAGYIPIYKYPLYQKKVGYGNRGCPFTCPFYKNDIDYTSIYLENVEYALKWSFSTEVVRPPLKFEDMDEIYLAVKRVLEEN